MTGLRPARAAAWLLGLVAAGALLRGTATGDLAAPPLTSLDGITAWVEARSPAAAAVGMARFAAELSVWYVLGLSALRAASEVLRVAGGHRLADALAVPVVRPMVQAGLGIGLVAASSVAGTDAEVPAAGTATMTPVVDAGAAAPRSADGRSGTATMRPHVEAPAPPDAAPAPPAPSTWTVASGESFWSIAEELLADAWGRAPTDAEIDPYWRSLVEANRGRLADPGDPDLIHPGQVFELPPVPSPVT